jgi:hypothetical protein
MCLCLSVDAAHGRRPISVWSLVLASAVVLIAIVDRLTLAARFGGAARQLHPSPADIRHDN